MRSPSIFQLRGEKKREARCVWGGAGGDRGGRKCAWGVQLQDGRGRTPTGCTGREVGRANPGTAAYLRLHCKTPVAGAPGSSCRRRPGAAAWPAAGGRAPAGGCGPRRPWRARWGPGSGCWGAGWSAGHAPPHLARSPAQTFCPLCQRAQRRGDGAGQCTRRRRKRLGGGERAQPGSAPPLPSMAVFAAGSGRAAVLLRSEDPLLLLSVAGGQCRPGAPSSPPPAPRRPALPRTPAFVVPSLAQAAGFPHHLARCAAEPRALRT